MIMGVAIVCVEIVLNGDGNGGGGGGGKGWKVGGIIQGNCVNFLQLRKVKLDGLATL